jgi:hypothetical protein
LAGDGVVDGVFFGAEAITEDQRDFGADESAIEIASNSSEIGFECSNTLIFGIGLRGCRATRCLGFERRDRDGGHAFAQLMQALRREADVCGSGFHRQFTSNHAHQDRAAFQGSGRAILASNDGVDVGVTRHGDSVADLDE